jgi:transposase
LAEAAKQQDKNYRIPEELKKLVTDDYNTYSYTKRQLAEKYNLKFNTISKIIRKSREPKKLVKLKKEKIKKPKKIRVRTPAMRLSVSIKNKKNKRKITNDIKQEIIKLYEVGCKTRKELAEMFDISCGYISILIKRKDNLPKELNIIDVNEKNNIIELKNKGKSFDEISKILGIPRGRISYVSMEYNKSIGLPQKTQKNSIKNVYKEIIPEIMKLYNEDILTKPQIAEKFNLSLCAVGNIIKVCK